MRRIGRSCLGLLAGAAVLALTFPTLDRIPHLLAMFSAERAQRSFDDGKFAQSAANWKRALKIEPGNADLHRRLARTDEKLGADQASLAEYRRAIEIDPAFYDAYLELAALYADKLHDFPSSLHVLEAALNQHPGSVPARYAVYTGIGRSDIRIGDLNSAQKSLIQAVQLDPARGAAHCLLAEVLDLRGQGDRALGEWSLCAAMSNQSDVEKRWLVTAEQRLSRPLQP
jgi:Tfp pilus assembly protein PilF